MATETPLWPCICTHINKIRYSLFKFGPGPWFFLLFFTARVAMEPACGMCIFGIGQAACSPCFVTTPVFPLVGLPWKVITAPCPKGPPRQPRGKNHPFSKARVYAELKTGHATWQRLRKTHVYIPGRWLWPAMVVMVALPAPGAPPPILGLASLAVGPQAKINVSRYVKWARFRFRWTLWPRACLRCAAFPLVRPP